MKRRKTRILANRHKAKLKAKRRRQRARAAGLTLAVLLGIGVVPLTSCAQAGPASNPSLANPTPTDCLRVYDPRCGAIPRFDPIREGHPG